MDITQRGVVTLLRSAVTGEKLPLPEGFDLEAAYPSLKKHHMDAMLYDGAVRCGISKKLPVMQVLFQRYCQALLVSEAQMQQLARLFAAFDESGIDYMPLKGSKMKALYPKPELRYMGDADILIRLEQYDKIAPVMETLGFQKSGESDHEIIWRRKELLVELHKRLIPSYNKDFYRYFDDPWRFAVAESGSRYSMKPEDEWLFQFVHFAKHFRDGGIGCRYVVDLWMYLRKNPELNQQEIRERLDKLQLSEFYENTLQVIDGWFADKSANEKTDIITNYIFASGSWGDEDSRVLSQTIRGMGGKITGTNGKMVFIRETAFPNVRMLEGKYTVLKKAPWLLPAVWVYRPFYKLFKERQDVGKQKEKLAVLNTDSLTARQTFLREMGLEYHF